MLEIGEDLLRISECHQVALPWSTVHIGHELSGPVSLDLALLAVHKANVTVVVSPGPECTEYDELAANSISVLKVMPVDSNVEPLGWHLGGPS